MIYLIVAALLIVGVVAWAIATSGVSAKPSSDAPAPAASGELNDPSSERTANS